MLHADRSPADHAHRAELRDLVARLPRAQTHRWHEDLGTRSTAQVYRGRADLSRIEIPVESTVYLYGPQPFMADVRRGLIDRHLAPEAIRYEVFGPDSRPSAA